MTPAKGLQHIGVDVLRPLIVAHDRGHNRWHPSISPIAHVNQGETIELQLRDGMDVQFNTRSSETDVETFDPWRGIAMTGPVFIKGAEPGDLLEVEVVHVKTSRFGFTCILPGIGVLGARFDQPFFVKWSIERGIARSRGIPGIAIRGRPFLGLMGVSPSLERLKRFRNREAELASRGYAVGMPDPKHAVPQEGVAATHGLRTTPPRENGGNMDIKHLGVGSRLILPVDVPGALFSAGDPHFAQGDGESCGVAIETSAVARLRFGIIKAADVRWRPQYPSYVFTERGTRKPRRWMATTGIPVTLSGINEFLNLNVAAEAAVEEMIGYLTSTYGYSRPQAYVIVSVAADLQVSEAVDFPNALVSVALPLDIFEKAALAAG